MARKWVSCFVTAICLLTPLSALSAEQLSSVVPIEAWLKGPDRQDIAWEVQTFQSLTLQQRHLIQVLATIRGRDYLNGVPVRDLNFVTKVADEHGNWLNGESFDHFSQPANFSAHDSVHSFANLYLKTGSYTLAVIAYDSLHKTGNVWRIKLTVPAVVGRLPDLGRDFPVVEFLPAAKAALDLKSADWEHYPQGVLQSLMLDPLALGNGVAHLPVANQRPVRIDVIVNLSHDTPVLRSQLRQGCRDSTFASGDRSFAWNHCAHPEFNETDSNAYKFDQGLALEVGNIVSQMAPQAGCVRFSAIDALRQDTVADRVDASRIDWNGLSQRIASAKIHEIDVSLEHANDHLIWFKQFIEKVDADPYECGLPAGAANHVLIVVSMPMPFPLYTQVNTVKSYSPRPACYHLQMQFVPGKLPDPDQTEQVLNPLKPKALPFLGAEQLRSQLDFVLRDLATTN